MFRRGNGHGGRAIVVARLRGAGQVHIPALKDAAPLLLDTERAEFVADPRPPQIDLARGTIDFVRPGALVFGS
jgi:hypothetical protein